MIPEVLGTHELYWQPKFYSDMQSSQAVAISCQELTHRRHLIQRCLSQTGVDWLAHAALQ